jgi:NADPH-dependent glutamate synthase beta subunit-like oxidoreductase
VARIPDWNDLVYRNRWRAALYVSLLLESI